MRKNNQLAKKAECKELHTEHQQQTAQQERRPIRQRHIEQHTLHDEHHDE